MIYQKITKKVLPLHTSYVVSLTHIAITEDNDDEEQDNSDHDITEYANSKLDKTILVLLSSILTCR